MFSKIHKTFKKFGIILGISKRYKFECREVLIFNENGIPINSYIERIKVDLLTGKYIN